MDVFEGDKGKTVLEAKVKLIQEFILFLTVYLFLTNIFTTNINSLRNNNLVIFSF